MGAERAGPARTGPPAALRRFARTSQPGIAAHRCHSIGAFCVRRHPAGLRSGIRTELSKLCISLASYKLPSQKVFAQINDLHSELFDDVVHFLTVRSDGLRTWCVQIAMVRGVLAIWAHTNSSATGRW